MSQTERKWFLLLDGRTSGPFTEAELELTIGGSANTLIWGRGLGEWAGFDRWKQIKDQKIDQIAPVPQAAGSTGGSTEPSQAKSTVRLWKVRVRNDERKPMTYDQMIELLKGQMDYNDVRIWTEGYSDWKEIYQIHKIIDELGVSRRKHPRVPIMGTIKCEGAAITFESRVLSISEGGLGIIETPPIKIGEKFKVILKSPNLFGPIHATAEIVYVGGEGYAGLKFVGLQTESKNAVIEYVKKFQELRHTVTNSGANSQ
jgi:hypothetical protein